MGEQPMNSSESITNERELNEFIRSQMPSPEEQAAQWKKIFEDEINQLKGKQH
jgi:hypothetical protein